MNTDEQAQVLLKEYAKQWQKSFDGVLTQLAPALDMQQQKVRASLRPILEAQESLRKALAPVLELAQSLFPAVHQFLRVLSELPAQIREAILVLAKRGWYFDHEMPLPRLWRLENALLEGDVARAEDALCEYFDGRLAGIEESILARFPHRAHLVRAAFDAHRKGEYALSIPVLLTQTDGICKEVMGKYLFIKGKKTGKPATAAYVEQITTDYYTAALSAALLTLVAETLPISESEGERPSGSDALNRHTVLHGEDLSYGTKRNSLKAVSLINYVAHVVGEDDQRNP